MKANPTGKDWLRRAGVWAFFATGNGPLFGFCAAKCYAFGANNIASQLGKPLIF
jgi:hypothetical protein